MLQARVTFREVKFYCCVIVYATYHVSLSVRKKSKKKKKQSSRCELGPPVVRMENTGSYWLKHRQPIAREVF